GVSTRLTDPTLVSGHVGGECGSEAETLAPLESAITAKGAINQERVREVVRNMVVLVLLAREENCSGADTHLQRSRSLRSTEEHGKNFAHAKAHGRIGSASIGIQLEP